MVKFGTICMILFAVWGVETACQYDFNGHHETNPGGFNLAALDGFLHPL